ncbi:MAG: hypothetical protein IPM17_07820 [Verrucomicrobia bacterium]|nr:hypothetical protein [Verrucomicrobiota bacterium]
MNVDGILATFHRQRVGRILVAGRNFLPAPALVTGGGADPQRVEEDHA